MIKIKEYNEDQKIKQILPVLFFQFVVQPPSYQLICITCFHYNIANNYQIYYIFQKYNQQMSFIFSKQNVHKSLQYLLNGKFITQSQQYLNRCQRDPKFPYLLLQIIQNIQQSNLRLQTFILFSNVLKRNWLSNRKNICVVNLDLQKSIIRNTLANYYRIPNFPYPKCLDDLVKYISKHDYPNDWPQLHNYFMQTLKSISTGNIIYNELMLRQLDIINNVMKQQSKKRSFINKCVFEQYTAHLIPFLLDIFDNINVMLAQSLLNKRTLSTLELKISRNIDRIILCILLTLNPELQDNQTVARILSKFLGKLETLVKLFSISHEKELIQKCIKTNIKNLSYIQCNYPFSFTNFLFQYENMLLNLFINNKYLTNQSLIKNIVISLTKILRTFNYYADAIAFKSSILNRNSKKNYQQHQYKCHQQFLQFFSPTTIQQIFNTVVLQIFNYKQQTAEQVIQQEDGSAMPEADTPIHGLGSILLYQVISKFKQTSLQLVVHLLQGLIQGIINRTISPKVQSNIYMMLLVLPRILSKSQLPLDLIFKILEYLVTSKAQRKMFAVVSSKYISIFTQSQLQSVFTSLIQICTNPQSDLLTIYQSAIAIKRILSESSQELVFPSLSGVLERLVGLFDKFENPTLVWNLVNLSNKIMQSTDFDINIINGFLNSSSLKKLVHTRNETLLYPICELLQNLILRTNINEVTLATFMFIRNNLATDMQNKQILFTLLLTAAQCYSSVQNNALIDQQFLNLFQKIQEQIKQEYPVLYIQLLQQYLLMGIIKPSNESLVQIIINVFEENMGQIKVKYTCLELYQTLMTIRPVQFNQRIILLVLNTLSSITDVLSVQSNNLRTNIICIINRYLIQNSESFLKKGCQILFIKKQQLQELWLRNLEFLNSKLAFKINSLALLIMLDTISYYCLDLYFETIIKIIMIQLQPLQQRIQFGSKKLKGSVRKQSLKRNNPYVKLDLKQLFKQKIYLILQKYNLSIEFIRERIKSQTVLQRIKSILEA